jgi:hypothetical protein
MSKQEGFKHSPEPWYADETQGSIYNPCPNGHTDGGVVCNKPDRELTRRSHEKWPANRDRIIACVNACAGVKNPEPLHKVIQCLKYIKSHWYVPNDIKDPGVIDDSILITFPGGKLERAKFVAGIETLLTKLETEPKE